MCRLQPNFEPPSPVHALGRPQHTLVWSNPTVAAAALQARLSRLALGPEGGVRAGRLAAHLARAHAQLAEEWRAFAARLDGAGGADGANQAKDAASGPQRRAGSEDVVGRPGLAAVDPAGTVGAPNQEVALLFVIYILVRLDGLDGRWPWSSWR